MNAFRAAVEAADPDAMRAALHDDVVLHSPIAYEPFRGGAVVGRLLEVLLEHVFEGFVYTDQLAGDGTHALVFRARIGDRDVQGIDLLRYRGGVIHDFTVLVRPMSAMTALRDAVAPHYAWIIGGDEG